MEREQKQEFKAKEKYDINDLRLIMALLRSENGCPWDKEQTHASIRMSVLEEAYEVMEAIDANDAELLREELGDLLLQIVFHSRMSEENGSFDFDGVCDGICKKLIFRHPHVFGNLKLDNSEEVLRNWDSLKSKSKGEESVSDRLESVPRLLPALMRGEKVGKRAANAGFDFSSKEEVIDSLKIEIAELEKAFLNEDDVEIEEEFGDILFTCCNLGRFLKKDSEKALTSSINKFIMRFRVIEMLALESGLTLDKIPQDKLNKLWIEAKKRCKIK